MTERQRTAYHEAGHFVAAQVLGRRPTKATVDELPGSGGRYGGLSWSCPRRRDDLSEIRTDLVISLAGAVAADIAAGNDWRLIPPRIVLAFESEFPGSESEQQLKQTVARVLRPDCDHDATAALAATYGVDEAMHDALAKAARLLERRWASVVSIAATLDRHGIYEPSARLGRAPVRHPLTL